MTDLGLLLHKFVPQIVIVGDRFESRGQTETMPMRREQLHAKRVDRSAISATKCFHDLQRQSRFENPLSCPLLHFIRGAICVSHHDELRQPFECTLTMFRNLENPISDRACFARSRGRDDGEISVQLASESLPRSFVDNGDHLVRSLFSSPKAGCVSAHFSSSRSMSIGSVARGYCATNPKSA